LYIDRLYLWGLFCAFFIAENFSNTLLGVEQIGNEIENPFGHDFNDLPIDEICTSVSANVEQAIAYSLK
jgi:putative membrane protein